MLRLGFNIYPVLHHPTLPQRSPCELTCNVGWVFPTHFLAFSLSYYSWGLRFFHLSDEFPQTEPLHKVVPQTPTPMVPTLAKTDEQASQLLTTSVGCWLQTSQLLLLPPVPTLWGSWAHVIMVHNGCLVICSSCCSILIQAQWKSLKKIDVPNW